MIKILHYIKLGQNNLTDLEIINLESWKRVYPDFKIMYWDDKNSLELLSDCPYMQFCYDYHFYGFVSDYLRLKVVYLYGGMYMDTDVFCVNRIPDNYFEKAFIPWSPEFGSISSCTGTACYSPKPMSKLYKNFLARYQSLDKPTDPNIVAKATVNNKYIDKMLYDMGLNIRDPYGCSFKDQDLGQVVIVNRLQFGYTDFRGEYPMKKYLPNNSPIYLMHNYLSSWGVKLTYNNCDLWYTVIKPDTDIRNLIYKVTNLWGNTSKHDTSDDPALIFFINSLEATEEELSLRMHILDYKDTFDMKAPITWRIAYLGNGLSDEEVAIMINTYICTKIPKINSVKQF